MANTSSIGLAGLVKDDELLTGQSPAKSPTMATQGPGSGPPQAEAMNQTVHT